jgi:hypothetical protein
MSDVARTPAVVQRYPAISRALLLSASEQLRNMASSRSSSIPCRRRVATRSVASPPNPSKAASRTLIPDRPESEAVMTVLTRNQALGVIRRAYGPDRAESLAERLPAQIDTEDPADHKLLFELGLTRERLVEALGAEW